MAVLSTPLAPGERLAPDEATLTLPLMVPLPPRVVPELFTVTALPEAVEPFTKSDPAITVVLPVNVFTPLSVKAPVPILVNAPTLLKTPEYVEVALLLPTLKFTPV